MSVELHVFETVLAFALVVLLAALLRQLRVVKQDDTAVFARLLTEAVLPVVIFSQLATNPIASRQLLLVLAMFIAGVASLTAAWLAGVALRLDRPRIGALMITSAFGSSALLGYPLVQYAFPNDPQAMTDAILVSELGVGLPIFILCPAIAMYFGNRTAQAVSVRSVMLEYFRSPIFIAVVAGLIAARLPINPDQVLFAPVFEAMRMINGSLTVLACLILGLQLKFVAPKNILVLVLVSALIQMGLQPWVAGLQATLYHLTAEQRHVLVLISSLPSAVLGPVFAVRFNCDAELASALVFINILLSLVSVPAVFGMLS